MYFEVLLVYTIIYLCLFNIDRLKQRQWLRKLAILCLVKPGLRYVLAHVHNIMLLLFYLTEDNLLLRALRHLCTLFFANV